ncbi:MAG: gamma carbonic anhydrase family protein [Pseudomonadota bacterium]
MSLYEFNGRRPTLPEDGNFWIAPGAHVVGDVVIGSGVSIWFGAVLRGDNESIVLGAGTNIQENAVLHTDMGFPMTLGADVTVGHRALLHGCTIEAGALIGMGATVLNGAVIGAGALVGAAALVTEGKVIAPGMLAVGSPAKQVRALDDAARAANLATAQHYQTRAAQFRSTLKTL